MDANKKAALLVALRSINPGTMAGPRDAEDLVFLAVQDAVGPGGRLGGVEVEQIEVSG